MRGAQGRLGVGLRARSTLNVAQQGVFVQSDTPNEWHTASEWQEAVLNWCGTTELGSKASEVPLTYSWCYLRGGRQIEFYGNTPYGKRVLIILGFSDRYELNGANAWENGGFYIFNPQDGKYTRIIRGPVSVLPKHNGFTIHLEAKQETGEAWDIDTDANGVRLTATKRASDPTPATKSPSIWPGNIKVLIIGPGASLREQNGYRHLLLVKYYDIYAIEGFPDYGYGESMGYPNGWESGLPEVDQKEKNLATLAGHLVVPQIQTFKPDVILCGSRGGQVTIGLVWQAMINGDIPVTPTVVLNAGCTIIPTERFPVGLNLVLVTGGRDYFKSKDPKWTKKRLQTKCKGPTFLYHFKTAEHTLVPEFDLHMDDILRTALHGQARGSTPVQQIN